MRVRTNEWLDRFDAHLLIIAATRYHLGRMTIATDLFAEDLAKAWDELPDGDKLILQQDIEKAFEWDDIARAKGIKRIYLPLGMDCDRQAWEKVRAKFK